MAVVWVNVKNSHKEFYNFFWLTFELFDSLSTSDAIELLTKHDFVNWEGNSDIDNTRAQATAPGPNPFNEIAISANAHTLI